MSDERAYRIHLAFRPESDGFIARVPELGVEAEAETRAEALERVERAIEAAFEQAAVREASLPKPADSEPQPGALKLDLAGPIHRDLLFHARAQGLEPEALAMQLLARGLGQMDGRRAPRPPAPEPKPKREEPAPAAEGANDGGRRNRARGRNPRREGYRPEMEDQANFLAYVRDQERGGRGRR